MCFLCAGLKGCGNDSDWKVTDLRLGSSPCHLLPGHTESSCVGTRMWGFIFLFSESFALMGVC